MKVIVKKRKKSRGKVGRAVTSVKIWVAGAAAEVAGSLGLLRPMDLVKREQLDESPGEQPSEQPSKQPSEDASQTHTATIPTVCRPLGQGGGYNVGSYDAGRRHRFDDPANDFARVVPAPTYGAITVPVGHGHGTHYHQCDDLYDDIRLLSPEPVQALGEQRRVPVTVEYLSSVPACYPHVGLKRVFLLIRVRRGSKRTYRVLIPAGIAHSPIVEQASLEEAIEFFEPGELVAIGKSQPLKLAKLVKEVS